MYIYRTNFPRLARNITKIKLHPGGRINIEAAARWDKPPARKKVRERGRKNAKQNSRAGGQPRIVKSKIPAQSLARARAD